MSRMMSVSSAVFLLLIPALALAAPAHKRHAVHNRGYGFLPGYHQPPNESIPVYGARGNNRDAPAYVPRYWWNGAWRYFGRPGFYNGRYNGGSFGPCWTITPIGRVWNCG